NVEGAIPNRRQENDGVRTRRATWLGISRRGFLSNRRRCWADWDVESVSGVGRTRLGEAGKPAEDDCSAVVGLRASRACVFGKGESQPDVAERRDIRVRSARAETVRRLHHAGDLERVRRYGVVVSG